MKLEEKTKMYATCRVEQDYAQRMEQEGQLETEEATIREAYFGRLPTPDLDGTSPLGLYITIHDALGRTATASYTRREDIEGMMDDLGVQRTEEMAGKKVLAHKHNVTRLIGLSVPQTD